jgi:hypothetical protein
MRLRGPDRREAERFFDFTLQPMPEEDGRLERVTRVRECESAKVRKCESAKVRKCESAKVQGMKVPSRQERMNSPLEIHEVRLRGLPVPHAVAVHRSAVFAGEAPRSLRGFPQSLRRLQPLRLNPGRCVPWWICRWMK